MRLRLDFLDGIRGMAACFVMVSHTYELAMVDSHGAFVRIPSSLLWLQTIFSHVHFAVAVFIVLSGFCLMLPAARTEDRSLPGGLLSFVKRRAKRILPPYYAALLVVLGILFASHHLFKHAAATSADLSAGDIITHFLLIHNLWLRYYAALDGPMWSVGWEWQIYFIFAFLLIPIWKRFGINWTIAAAFGLGFLPILALHAASNFAWTCPWYLGLFALGMGSAVIAVSGADQYKWIKDGNNQLLLACILGAIVVMINLLWPSLFEGGENWPGDLFVGALASLLILMCANKTNPSLPAQAAVKFLEARPSMTLGAFSYSIYLVHYPVLMKLRNIMRQHNLSPHLQLAALMLICVPICLGLAYLFHLAFERPFMPGSPKTERQAEIAAIVSPAP